MQNLDFSIDLKNNKTTSLQGKKDQAVTFNFSSQVLKLNHSQHTGDKIRLFSPIFQSPGNYILSSFSIFPSG